jgi:hypothetical protein
MVIILRIGEPFMMLGKHVLHCYRSVKKTGKVCKRMPRYILTKSRWNQGAQRYDFELRWTLPAHAEFCWQHGMQEVRKHNARLARTRERRTPSV